MAPVPKKIPASTPKPAAPTQARKRRTSLEFCEPRAICRIIQTCQLVDFTLEELASETEDYLRTQPSETLDDDMATLAGHTPRELAEVLEICVTDMMADRVLSRHPGSEKYFDPNYLRSLAVEAADKM